MFICTAINYFLGSISNNKLAKKWLETVKPVLKQQFARVGSFDTETDMDFIEFEDQNRNEFPLLLKGRQNMHFAKTNLVLEKRYDIATVFFTKIPVIRKFFHY